MLWRSLTWIVCGALITLAACGDDSDSKTSDAGKDSGTDTAGTGGGSSGSGGSSGTGSAQSLCDKYGGKKTVHDAITVNVIGKIAGDCRINKFFTTLPTARLTHLSECLATQAEELFGCDGVKYEGSSYGGAPCRSMTAAHVGLDINSGDFTALLDDVVAGLTEKGVSSADIGKAAPALVGLKSQIVTASPDATDPSMSICVDDAGAGDAG